MYNIPGDLLDAFKAAPEVVAKVLEGCTQEQAVAAKGGDENWSVVEVVCHLRDAEERGLQRTRQMRDQDDPFLEGYDQDAWARERNYAADDLHDALTAFLRFRKQHITELAALRPEDWERTGRHEEQGQITITGQIIHLAAHDAIHTAQIARQLG
ncbi:MAG: DinB family protein [Chloroflexia bacterium]